MRLLWSGIGLPRFGLPGGGLPGIGLLGVSAAKPDPFFRVEPNFGPKIRVELGRVGPQGQKKGPIGSGWPQIGFKCT